MPSDFLATVGGFIVFALALCVIPLLPLLIGSRVINAIEDARSPWTPFIELLALLIGALAGALVLAHNLAPGATAAGAIFRQGGPWDLTAGQFLGHWGNPLAYDYRTLLPWPFAGFAAAAPGTLVLLFGAAVVAAPILAWPSARSIATAWRNLLVLLWGAYAAAYGFCFALWLLNKLNFWAFLLLILVIHVVRSRGEELVLRLK
jgi:hypothetical protein